MTHPTSSETTFNDEELDALVAKMRMIQEWKLGAEAADTITALREQLAEAWTRLDYWCERSIEWDAEMLQKDKEVLEAIARADRAEANARAVCGDCCTTCAVIDVHEEYDKAFAILAMIENKSG